MSTNTTTDVSEVRPLAYVTPIKELNPIDGADRIELATVLGWKVIVRKGMYNIGDLVIYFEIDSLLPKWDIFQDLEKTKYRIKTIKLRGVFSNGYCCPLSEFSFEDTLGFVNSDVSNNKIEYREEVDGEIKSVDLTDGIDLTNILQIRKWEILDDNRFRAGRGEGYRPSYIRKTDQTRIQNKPEFFEKYGELEFEVSEKLEGSSITTFIKIDDFGLEEGVCTRNMRLMLTDEESVAVQLIKKYEIMERLREYGKSIALQGEIIGPGIQGNIYGLTEFQWRIFDIFDIFGQKYLDPLSKSKVLEDLEIVDLSVPILDTIKLNNFDLDSLVELADGKSVLNKHVNREGIVFKSYENVGMNDEPVSFKAISNKYLLKQG